MVIENKKKRLGIINNSTTDPNKILPLTYPWAREHYKNGLANNWTPEEIGMQSDVETMEVTNSAFCC